MIRELAEYEREPDSARATTQQLHDALFGPDPAVFALLAEDDALGAPVGFALWFRNFSTWTGTHGVYLEDLYVRPLRAAAATARPCSPDSPPYAWNGATNASNGPCWTGTSRPSPSTVRWAPVPRTNGRCND